MKSTILNIEYLMSSTIFVTEILQFYTLIFIQNETEIIIWKYLQTQN